MKVIDLFCGAGGFSKGFEMVGFDIILGVDNWGLALRNFRLNHPNAKTRLTDVKKLNPKDLPKADVIIGGTPCQEFTSLNLKKQPWRGMINVCHFLRVVEKYKPKYWIMENVLGLKKYLPSYLHYRQLKASNFGCKSGRTRLFVGKFPPPLSVGILSNPSRTLTGIDNRNKNKSKVKPVDLEEMKFVGSEKEVRQLQANAVPPKLAKAIAQSMKSIIIKEMIV